MPNSFLVTGANSGVGLGLVKRLSQYADQSQQQIIIYMACRSKSKATKAIEEIETTPFCELQFVQLDLLSLDDIVRVASDIKQVDVLYCNAGILPIDCIDWVNGPLALVRNPIRFFTDVSATLKQSAGLTVQVRDQSFGMVFMANVFGHYMLLRKLSVSKVIWTGSQTSSKHFFDLQDFQGFQTKYPYESSKVLIEYISSGLSRSGQQSFVCDPGVVNSQIVSGTLSSMLSLFIITPLLWLAQFVIASVTYSAVNGAESLVKIGISDGMDTQCKYSSASWIMQPYVTKQVLEVTGKEGQLALQRMDQLMHRLE